MWASPLQRSLCFNQGLNGFRNQRERTVKLENLRNTCCTGSGRLSKVAEMSHWGGEERYWKLSIVFVISSLLKWCVSFAFEDIFEEYCNGGEIRDCLDPVPVPAIWWWGHTAGPCRGTGLWLKFRKKGWKQDRAGTCRPFNILFTFVPIRCSPPWSNFLPQLFPHDS